MNVSTTWVAKLGAMIQEHCWFEMYGSFEMYPDFLVKVIPSARQLGRVGKGGMDGNVAHARSPSMF
jgi:hypothetical protein